MARVETYPLKGQLAWVTGAGTGIGRCVALSLAREGAPVILSGRRENVLRDVQAEIQAGGGDATVRTFDVKDRLAVFDAAKAISQEQGKIRMLVNSAGLNITDRHWDRLNGQGWDDVLNTNLVGAYNCIAAVLPEMRRNHDGLIVNIASWVGERLELRAGVPYNVSKQALCALTETLNMENGTFGVRASVVCPAEVATELVMQRPKKPTAEELKAMLSADDIADVVCYLARCNPKVCINKIVLSPSANAFYLKN